MTDRLNANCDGAHGVTRPTGMAAETIYRASAKKWLLTLRRNYRAIILGVCQKNGNWPAAALLPVRFVGPFLTARFGDARNGPPRAQPKSLAAAHSRFFRQTLTRF